VLRFLRRRAQTPQAARMLGARGWNVLPHCLDFEARNVTGQRQRRGKRDAATDHVGLMPRSAARTRTR